MKNLQKKGMADLFEPWFAFHCHRAPPRTLRLFGYGLPVCARCTGLYMGLLLGALIGQLGVSDKRLLQAMLLGGALLGLDVATEAIGLRVPSLTVRFITGVAFALPTALTALRHARHASCLVRRPFPSDDSAVSPSPPCALRARPAFGRRHSLFQRPR